MDFSAALSVHPGTGHWLGSCFEKDKSEVKASPGHASWEKRAERPRAGEGGVSAAADGPVRLPELECTALGNRQPGQAHVHLLTVGVSGHRQRGTWREAW